MYMAGKKAAKRRRPSVEDDLDPPPLKMRRIAGMDIGPNHRPYRNMDLDPYAELSSESNGSGDMESPTQQRRLWQNRDGRTRRGLEDSLAPELQDLWLESNKNWKYGLNELWKGKKVLGMGGYGLVGLWEYKKRDDDVIRVVVKQSAGKDRALKSESDVLSRIAETGTKHVVRLLKKYHEERGQGTSDQWDSDSGYVSRIYLEYCPHGDMKAVMKKLRYVGSPMHIWS